MISDATPGVMPEISQIAESSPEAILAFFQSIPELAGLTIQEIAGAAVRGIRDRVSDAAKKRRQRKARAGRQEAAAPDAPDEATPGRASPDAGDEPGSQSLLTPDEAAARRDQLLAQCAAMADDDSLFRAKCPRDGHSEGSGRASPGQNSARPSPPLLISNSYCATNRLDTSKLLGNSNKNASPAIQPEPTRDDPPGQPARPSRESSPLSSRTLMTGHLARSFGGNSSNSSNDEQNAGAMSRGRSATPDSAHIPANALEREYGPSLVFNLGNLLSVTGEWFDSPSRLSDSRRAVRFSFCRLAVLMSEYGPEFAEALIDDFRRFRSRNDISRPGGFLFAAAPGIAERKFGISPEATQQKLRAIALNSDVQERLIRAAQSDLRLSRQGESA